MDALLLGGMSQRHHEWVRNIAAVLRPHFEQVRFLDYKHWSVTHTEMNLEYELDQAAELAKDLDDYIVIAKSIGSVITTLACSRATLHPTRCVFLGFPLKVVEKQRPEVASALTALPPTSFVHNEFDPLGSAKAVEAYIAAHAPKQYSFQAVAGDTHEYTDFTLISALATQTAELTL